MNHCKPRYFGAAVLEQRIKPAIQEFLAVRGLELSLEKTHLTHISKGFDFLGQNIRKYNGKLLIKSSKKNVEVFLAKIKKAIKERTAARPIDILEKLAPMIRGWAMYHRHIDITSTTAKTTPPIAHTYPPDSADSETHAVHSDKIYAQKPYRVRSKF